MTKKQRAQELLEYVENIRDEEGYAVVDVNIGEDTLYDPLSLKGNKDLTRRPTSFRPISPFASVSTAT